MYEVHYKTCGEEFIKLVTDDERQAYFAAVDLMCEGYGRIWIVDKSKDKEEQKDGQA